MFKVKICGVRFKSDVVAVAHAGGDAIGLNFFDQSIRFVDPDSESTKQLAVAAAEQGIAVIGVFVNAAPDEIAKIAASMTLAAVQLHGDETTGVAQDLCDRGLKVIRAIKLPIADLTPKLIQQRCAPWRSLGCHLLLDVDGGTAHGGTGKCLNWEIVRIWAEDQPANSWTLAGGLTPENVADAIRVSGAASVDTASGAEDPRGTKSPQRITNFVHSALAAYSGD